MLPIGRSAFMFLAHSSVPVSASASAPARARTRFGAPATTSAGMAGWAAAAGLLPPGELPPGELAPGELAADGVAAGNRLGGCAASGVGRGAIRVAAERMFPAQAAGRGLGAAPDQAMTAPATMPPAAAMVVTRTRTPIPGYVLTTRSCLVRHRYDGTAIFRPAVAFGAGSGRADPAPAGLPDGPGIMAGVKVSANFSVLPEGEHREKIEQLCQAMEAADDAGFYPRLTVERPWSAHNPVLEGEFASPRAIRWYLLRELGRLAAAGALISVTPGRQALDLRDPDIGPAIDETRADLRRKKLFLFEPERMALSIDRLQHYTGTPAEMFQRYVLLTNYDWHVSEFRAALPDSIGPDSDGRQMPAWHHVRPGQAGLTMVNIGVGPSNAKTLTDHLAVLRPDLVLMIGHCGGLRNHQEIGDLVLATAFLRDDRVLDDVLPLSVPVISNHTLNTLLLEELTSRGLRVRMGIVFTTANRNWEMQLATVSERLRLSRTVAVDMESATVAANGFRYRIPTATLLAVSDKPFHGRPKLSADAARFYAATRRQHVEIAIAVAQRVAGLYPGGLPTADIRSADEPLLGLTDAEPARRPPPGS